MVNMFNLLRGTCLFCHRFKISRTVVRLSLMTIPNFPLTSYRSCTNLLPNSDC